MGVCPKCQGVFDKGTKRLADLQKGSVDRLGNRVHEVEWMGEDYAVYRSDKGIYVHFADCREKEREQRRRYDEIAAMLCQLRFLSSQMNQWKLRLRRTLTYYDHQIVQAMVLALEGRDKDAKSVLHPALGAAVRRLTNENRVKYLLACAASGLVIGVLVWLLLVSPAIPAGAAAYAFAGLCGLIGAVFSIGMRVQTLELVPCQDSFMNSVMGALRVVIGFIAGALLLLIFTATALGDGFAAFLQMQDQGMSGLRTLARETWLPIAVLGFVGGFAERLVPNLLHRASDHLDSPTEAVKETARLETATPGGAVASRTT
jgi:hypothetical protein